MITRRPYDALGGADRDWLKTRLHIAIGGLGKLEHSPLGALRVWNDDEIASASGFPLHEHRNLEIITYVRAGAVTHEDSLGNKGRTEAGDVQVMSAGRGIRHAEYNAESVPTRLFQIWLMPRTIETEPRWSTRRFPRGERGGGFVPLASGNPADAGALPINADARLLGASLRAGQTLTYSLEEGRSAYLVTTPGRVALNGLPMGPGDGAAVTNEAHLTIEARDDTEIVLVELA
jgi:redox-sensitive bicupin YhaK (pirin superfamily)